MACCRLDTRRMAFCPTYSRIVYSIRIAASCAGETALVAVEPQVFDLLAHLVRNRDRVVSKDELVAAIWHGRIVSESALFNRINAARSAIGDTGGKQRLIKTLPRKGLRFVADVREDEAPPPSSRICRCRPIALRSQCCPSLT